MSSTRKKNEVYIDIERYLSQVLELRYNIVNNQVEYRYLQSNEFKNLNDRVENSIYMQMKEDDCFKVTKGEFDTYMNSDRIREYNPYRAYFESLGKWDGVDYVKKIADYVNIDNIGSLDFFEQLKKWLIRLVKCALEPRFFNKQMLVFVGEEHNVGKTSFCRWLCPDALKDYFTEEDALGKDSSLQLASNLFVLNDELSKLTKVSLDEIKALMSKSEMRFRLPYGRREENFYRTASFLATSNKDQFLTDETGSVRFICGRVRSIDWQGYTDNIDINKVYSQIYYLYKNSKNYELTKEETDIIQEYNRRFYVTTTEEDFIQNYFRKPAKADYETTTPIYRWQAGQILQYLSDNNTGIKFNAVGIGKALKFLGFESRRLRVNGLSRLVYEVCLNYPSMFIHQNLKDCVYKKGGKND